MNRTSKLSLFIAVMLLLQTSLSGWSAGLQDAAAAPAGPVKLSLSPADDLINVPINTDLKITFDESIRKGTGSAFVSIVEYGSNRVLESIDVSTSRVILEDNERAARIVLDKTTAARRLELNTNYYILVDEGAFVNVSNGASYAGIDNASEWNFRTVTQVDTTRPFHTNRQPAGGNISITAPIEMTFDEPVYVAGGIIQITSLEDNRSIAVTSSAVTGSGTSTIVITPPAVLQPETDYTVTIPGTAFQDAAGNLYQGSSWTFTTARAPVNVNAPFSPADNATSVPISSPLTITFDQNVQARPGKNIEIRRVGNNTLFESFLATSPRVAVTNSQAVVSPSVPFEANTAYYVLIDAGAFTQSTDTNLWYHGISSATVWNFTTGYGNDSSAPYATAYSPANNAVVASKNALLQITFSEPVFPSSGEIEIREVSTNALFRSIPVISERVAGGGTNQLTIDANKAVSGEAAKAFVNNTKYYVKIGNRVIRDAVGNYYGGMSSTGTWSFTVTQDTISPTLTLLNPLNNATLVGLSSTFSATFSEPVKIGAGSTVNSIRFIPASGGSAGIVAGSYSVDSSDNRKINITPNMPLISNTAYYVYMDANAVTDMADNAFAGILNEYQWTFRTFGSDTAAPVLSKLQWSGSTITMFYNEALNADVIPSTGSFYVTVNGAPRAVSGIQIRGESVLLTLMSPIVAGQQVELSYSKTTPGLIQDLSANEAASVSLQEVTGAQDNTLPILVSGTASGSAITLVFSKDLAPVSSNAYLQFTVNIGGVNYSATSISSTGNSVLLTVSGTIQNYQNIKVSYSPGSYALRDMAGNYLNAITNYNLYSVPDTSAPSLQSVTASGSVVTLTYNKILNTASVPSVGQYSVLINNIARSVVQVQVSGNGVFLTLSSAVASGEVVTVSYLASTTLVIDLSGNPAPSFNHVSSGGSTGGSGGGQTGTIYGAIVKGSVLTLNFGESLNSGYVPSTVQFFVKVNETMRTVSSVSISGNSVAMTLASPVSIGDMVYVTYYSTSSGLRTNNGATVNSFANIGVANQTTILDGLSGDYEAGDGGGIGLKTTTATTSTDVSPAGVQANRYTVMSDRVLTAYQTARTAGLPNPRVVFKVPSTERAAIVAISIGTLDNAYRLNANSVFAVQYGDSTYELQLNAKDFTDIQTLLNGYSDSGQLLIRIDQGLSALTNNLNAKISSSNSQLLAGPYHFDVTAVNGTVQKPYNEFNGYVSRTIQNYQTIDASQSAVVWFDPQTGGLSYVPTEFTTSAGKTVATFKRQGNSSYALIRNTSSFADVSSHWAASTIHTLARKFIVEGRTASRFEPQKAITRGEFAAYIAKGLGLGGNKTAAAKFKDVNANTAMGVYIGSASSAGIVMGNTDGTFKPNSLITRQEMAVMLMRAAAAAGLNVQLPQSAASYLQTFKDRGKIGSYAQTDVAKAVYLGIINGKTSATVSPLTNATRAEGAVMLMRLLQKAKFMSP
ncbi:Ig-like domain-containing protein [Paenibacillus alkaliterrae]|uniref:Ig-like domain-containing protein n=1 Tax=Paenibacillus alkaliterrae TaxID=320909 RepID=UPI001F165BFB|nr:Ig-like domain-containing protein [Paenibacillus alkaliterrae]MCF2938349.1 Ig-like domain-containing protein [Paenibacillus alkaliterrae]